MSGELVAWLAFIASLYIAAFAVLQLEKQWHRTAQVFFSLATFFSLGSLVLWVWNNSGGLRGGIAFIVGVCALVANIWFVRKVEVHINPRQSPKTSPANDADYRRNLIESWRSMIVLAERKYIGGKEPNGVSFSEIFQRQPAFIQLAPLLSREAIDALDADVRDELSRTERKRPVVLRLLLAKEISRIEAELELFPRLVGMGAPTEDRKLLFEIDKRNTTIRVEQSNSALRVWLDLQLRFGKQRYLSNCL